MDSTLFELINVHWTSPTADFFMAVLSSWALWLPVLGVVVLVMVVRGRYRTWAWVLTVAIVLGLVDGVVCQFGKRLVNRPRPHEYAPVSRVVDLAPVRPAFLALAQPVVVIEKENFIPVLHGRSFPSGHVMNNFAVATVTVLFFPRVGWVLFLLAAGVSYSRIYTGAHWPSDVLVSAILAVGLALLITMGLARVYGWMVPRFFPGLAARYPQWLPFLRE